MVVIGGLGSIPGALLGAAFVKGAIYFSNSFPRDIQLLIRFSASNVGLIFVLMLLPGGLGSIDLPRA